MTKQQFKEIIDAGVDPSEIEYVMKHNEIGIETQEYLIDLLAKGDMEKYLFTIDELNEWDELDERKDCFPQDRLDELNEALDYMMSLEEPPKELPIQMQYLNNSLIMRKLFYYDGSILENLVPGIEDTAEFDTKQGEQWKISLWSDFFVPDDSLDPFDLAVLDVIYTLHENGMKAFSTKWIDILLSGSSRRNMTQNSIARIDHSIDKLTSVHIKSTINGEDRKETPLLSVERFGHSQGNIFYLKQINDLYAYAHDKHQIANTPNSYFDTSALPKEFAFADTETAIVLKRRVILRVMRILNINNGTARLRNWNRISLIQKKDQSAGLFPELGLMPDIVNLDPEAAEKKLKQWRTKQKPLYIKIIRGTLENLKRQYVILDYEEHKDNDSKNPKDPVTGFDIICFTKQEIRKLSRMRDEQKEPYVQSLLAKRKK